VVRKRRRHGSARPTRQPPPPDPAALEYLERPGEAIPGNRVELLIGGDQAYPRMLAAIGRAQRLVWLEVYQFWDDAVGRLFASALVERARTGIDVRVLVDAWGAAQTAGGLLEEMRGGGVKVATAFDLNPLQRAYRWFRRDHRKLLLVDGALAYTGGMNIGLPYAGRSHGGQGWEDLQLEVEGPAVRSLSRLFEKVWRRSRGVPIDQAPDGRTGGDEVVRVLANHVARSRKEIRHAYLVAFQRAERSIAIANAYFLPSPRMLRALLAAARRGVRVSIILPGRSDIPAFQLASRARYGRLLAAGARIFELEDAMLHAKAAVVDGLWTTVGSCNLDAWSMHRNLELNIAVLGPAMAKQVEDHLSALLPRCREVTLEEWRRTGWPARLLQLICLLLFIFW
jgi:cardiolipin synthase